MIERGRRVAPGERCGYARAVFQRLRAAFLADCGPGHGQSPRTHSAPVNPHREQKGGWALALLGLLVVGCATPSPGTTAQAAQQPPSRRLTVPDSVQAPAKLAKPAPTDLDEKRARSESMSILSDLASTRQLSLRGHFDVQVISRAGIRTFARDSMYERITPQEFALLTRIESSFGVLPVGVNGEDVLLDLLESGVLGLYDPKERTLFIGDFVPEAMLSMVVGHEIAHGLQDMHFDLEALQAPVRHQSDAESARTYLVEGDAQASYLAWLGGAQGLFAVKDDVLRAMGNMALRIPESASPYPILARQLQLPYADGAATVAQLARTSGWGAVDALYRDLPTTTEQMLHLDKLESREPAIPIALDAAPILQLAPQLRQVHHDTLGEAALLAMLADVESPTRARAAASGWGGGRYIVLDGDTALPTPFIAGLLAWDSAQDATEFVDAFSRYLGRHLPADEYLLEHDHDQVWFALRIPNTVERSRLASALRQAARIGAARRSD